MIAARGAIHSGEAADYQRYMVSVADILERSDAVGADLAQLLTSPGDTNRAGIQTRLDDLVATSEELQVEAEALDAPKDMVERGDPPVLPAGDELSTDGRGRSEASSR